MSYLSSILGSINNPGAARSATGSPSNAAAAARAPPPASASAGKGTSILSSTLTTATVPIKRKIESSSNADRQGKIARDGGGVPAPDSKASRPQSAAYGGTARPAASSTAAGAVTQSNPRQMATPSKPSASSAAPPPRPAAVAPSPQGPPPKKGSYKDILARAAANQKAQSNFGKVTHKPVEKLSRRERLKREEAEAAAAKKNGKALGTANGRHQASAPSGGIAKSGTAGRVAGGPKSAAEMSKEKPRRQPVDLGYKGTMRAGPASASARPAAKTRPGASSSSSRYGPKYRYATSMSPSGSDAGSYDHDDDLIDNDDEGDDDDDDDGGGGFDELEAEEEASLRAAQREDAEALRQENAHRREKEERRKKLTALAARRK